MAKISQNVNIEMLEKLPDGTYKRKYPKTTKEQVGLGNVDNLSAASIRSGTTKANVGLSNVDNVKQATKVEFDEHLADDANPHSTNKTHVGLSNVDNVKQMPISGGVLKNYREKLTTLTGTSTTINLSLGNVFVHTPSGNRTYSITNAISGQAHSFTLIVNMGSTIRTLTFPASVKWQGGEIPDMTEANKTYVLTFVSVDGGTTWLGMSGGMF